MIEVGTEGGFWLTLCFPRVCETFSRASQVVVIVQGALPTRSWNVPMILLLVLTFLAVTNVVGAVKVEKTEFEGWHNCCRISNREVELVVTADGGPRIIRFGSVGGQSLFKEYFEQQGKIGEGTFQARGGDRVWWKSS
jgi:hypothetical protein